MGALICGECCRRMERGIIASMERIKSLPKQLPIPNARSTRSASKFTHRYHHIDLLTRGCRSGADYINLLLTQAQPPGRPGHELRRKPETHPSGLQPRLEKTLNGAMNACQ